MAAGRRTGFFGIFPGFCRSRIVLPLSSMLIAQVELADRRQLVSDCSLMAIGVDNGAALLSVAIIELLLAAVISNKFFNIR